VNTHSVATAALRRGALAFAVAVALAACATPPAGAGDPVKSKPLVSNQDCIFSTVMDDWTDLSDEQLIIYGFGGKNRQAYLTTLTFPSHDLRFGIRLGIDDYDHDGRICAFDSIVIPGGAPDRIQIKSMVRIEPAEAKRLVDESKAARKAKKVKPGAAKSPEPAAAAPAPAVPGN